MKKIKFLALMSAIALTSAVGFTACSSSDEATADVNPTFDGTSVHTDFAFNITKASKGTTRMTANNTQEAGANFRGLQDMYLYAMKTASSATEPNGEDAVQTYPLMSIAANNLDDDASTITTPSSKIYPLSIPVGTNNFLFYARALQDGETNFEIGKVTFTGLSASSKATGSISFSLNPIEQPTGIATPRSTTESNFETYLNSIANAKDASNNTWAETVDKSSTDGRYSAISKLYTDFTRPVDGEVRSGSAESIMRTIHDLYTSMKKIINEVSGDTDIPVEIPNIAAAVCTAIESDIFTLTLKSPADTEDPYEISWQASVPASAQTYPASYDLPMGAAQLVWDGTNNEIKYAAFDYSNPAINTGFGGIETDKITYPAELLYFDNSPLIGTAEYKTVTDYPVTTKGWDTAVGGSSDDGTTAFDATWTQTKVEPSTRAVAMRNNVNYGVALLQSTVKIKNAGEEEEITQFKDNRKTIIGEDNQVFTLASMSTGNGLELTGILIGGQPGSVDWKMLPPSTETFAHAIYDKNLDTTGSWEINTSTKTLSTLYTVCFDNFKSGTQSDVCIALEFKNNLGKDFYGAKNMIPEGSTFYLVGKLSPSSGTGWTDSYPTSYRVSERATARVFGQDHKTIVTFSLAETSLQKAYSTVPDLRTTEMLFGLNVDLTWVNGLTFDIPIGE